MKLFKTLFKFVFRTKVSLKDVGIDKRILSNAILDKRLLFVGDRTPRKDMYKANIAFSKIGDNYKVIKNRYGHHDSYITDKNSIAVLDALEESLRG
jgi:hypothetical protein